MSIGRGEQLYCLQVFDTTNKELVLSYYWTCTRLCFKVKVYEESYLLNWEAWVSWAFTPYSFLEKKCSGNVIVYSSCRHRASLGHVEFPLPLMPCFSPSSGWLITFKKAAVVASNSFSYVFISDSKCDLCSVKHFQTSYPKTSVLPISCVIVNWCDLCPDCVPCPEFRTWRV